MAEEKQVLVLSPELQKPNGIGSRDGRLGWRGWGERDREREKFRRPSPERFRRPSFLHFLFSYISVRLSVSSNNLSQSLSFFLLFFCSFLLHLSTSSFTNNILKFSFHHYLLSVISFFLLILFLFLFLLLCFAHFHLSLFLLPFLSSLSPFLSLSLFLSFSVTFGTSVCLSLPLPLFLVPSLTLFCSPGASVSVCLFSWCLKLPLLQSGCWECGPKLPALGPRPLHFLNPLQLVSQRRAGCRENRKEVDPRGLGLGPLCPSCSWAARDRSAENILGEMPAWHPAHLGSCGRGVLGCKSLILGYRCQCQRGGGLWC